MERGGWVRREGRGREGGRERERERDRERETEGGREGGRETLLTNLRNASR